MATTETELELQVAKDHLESLTKASGTSALTELIWNSLDADASYIDISFESTPIGLKSITIEDDGHGVSHNDALEVFSSIGGSKKKEKGYSPGQRVYHGKEGKGRYKALALGDLVSFRSIYVDKGQPKTFKITLDRNNIKAPRISSPSIASSEKKQGVIIQINNLDQKACKAVSDGKVVRELEEKFALYNMSYPTFKICIDGYNLEFESLIKNVHTVEMTFNDDQGKEFDFIIKIVEWQMDCQKKIYLCNSSGISFMEKPIGVRATLPVSVSIQSELIEHLHRTNQLALEDLNPVLSRVIEEAKNMTREYLRNRIHQNSREFINDLKREQLYPYIFEPRDEVAKAERQVFDIVALHVHEYMPSFGDQDKKSKKLTLTLIKEALEHDISGLQKILTEIVGLPKEKRDELSEILQRTSLSNIIDTMNEVSNRLTFLQALEQIIYDKVASKNIKERKHLHKMVVNETWVFGDDYTYGADDVTLSNVLRAHLKFLGRDDFEETVSDGDNSNLSKIPDVCLWKQYSRGRAGKFENLIIELKKPTVDAGFEQYKQISDYSARVQGDPRFVKENHKWTFILLVRDIKEELEILCNQTNRRHGHVVQNEGLNVFILRWSDVIEEARARYQYIKDKLNMSLITNDQSLNFLRNRYKEYLPDEF